MSDKRAILKLILESEIFDIVVQLRSLFRLDEICDMTSLYGTMM